MGKRRSPILVAGCLTALLVLGILLAAVVAVIAFRYAGSAEPIDESGMHLTIPDIPDEENAYVQLQRAASLVEWKDDEYYYIQTMIDGTPEPPDLPQRFLESRQEAVAALHRAFECEESVYPEFEDPDGEVKKEALESLAWALWHDAERNDDTEARLQLALNLVDAGNLMKESCGPLFVFLRGARLQRHGLIMLKRVCGQDDLSPEALKHAIGRVAVTQHDAQSLSSSIRAEYWITKELVDEELGSRQWQFWVYDEEQNTRGMLSEYRARIDSAERFYCDVVIPPNRGERPFLMLVLGGNVIGDIMTGIMVPLNANSFAGLAYDRSNNSAVQVLLALKVYHMRHGELPESLDALVPEFFDELPRDWFDGGFIKYNREKALVYCVGADLVDNGGGDPEAKWTTTEDPSWSISFANVSGQSDS
ncbi:MAG: hypothetical protein KJ060_20270 [Candidatus Hydrogenedentes bacterium]|nr:hypothetical protein [Candidatus Hydrogenedentota bacterium]